LTEGDTLDGGDLLPGFTLPVSEIFRLDWTAESGRGIRPIAALL